MKLNKNKFEIAVIIGTRAELIKTFHLILELQKRNVGYYFIHTGQHSLGDLCKKLGVKKPDIILSKEPKKSSKFNAKNLKGIFLNIFIIPKIRKVLKNLESLRYVVYHGDTMTTASASIASSNSLRTSLVFLPFLYSFKSIILFSKHF